MRPQDTFCFAGKTVDWVFSQLQNREGSATRKIKTVSKGGPPAQIQPKGCATRPEIQNRFKGWATRQPDHAPGSTTASKARKCCASNPGPTTRLRSFLSRTSIAAPCPALASGTAAASFSSTNFAASACLNRFFQAKNCGAHTPRSRQNTATLCPLRACSETTLRHFVHAFFPRL